MAGLLFVFVLMIVAFATKLTDQRARELRNRDRAIRDRTVLLATLRDQLELAGLQVEVDDTQGVLRLGAEILFPSGRSDPDERGHANLEKLSRALASVVPRYTRSHGDTLVKHVDALFIEGHTDDVPVSLGARYRSNWDLSALRAISVFDVLTSTEPTLDSLRNGLGQPILGVAGYADRRPVPMSAPGSHTASAVSDTMRARNRRIDLRFIMESPFEPERDDPRPETRSEYERIHG